MKDTLISEKPNTVKKGTQITSNMVVVESSKKRLNMVVYANVHKLLDITNFQFVKIATPYASESQSSNQLTLFENVES